MTQLKEIENKIKLIIEHSENPQDYADAIQVSNDVLNKLAKLTRTNPEFDLDSAKTRFWNYIFKAEDLLGVNYSNELGYINYPTWVFNK